MNDVTALMGKLKANVAYLQFDEPTERREIETDLGRDAPADGLDDAPAAEVEAAAPPRPASLLSRYVPAVEPIPAREVSAASRLLADIFARLERAA